MSEDKEKKIAEIEEKYDRSGYLYGEQEEWLINQLKECREEIDRLRKVCETRRELCKLEKLGG